MKGNDMNDERFERLIQQMRDESVEPARIEAAQERVWQRLHATGRSACDELRPALADHARGGLSEARRLLVEDHLSRCLGCRHALAEVEGRTSGATVVTPFPARARRRWVPWAVAASLLLVVAYVGRQTLDTALAPRGPRAVVESVSGTLLALAQGAVQSGAELRDGDIVRTSAGSGAVLRLADGSRLEMNGRTELDLQGGWSGDTVRLRRGDVVVQAAEQGWRRLRVVTRDSVAAVRGTVFAVSAGTVGSLVSVVEGEVAVSQPGFERLLSAGEQAASNPALASVTFEQALSWSADADDYYALLADLGEVEQRIAALTGSALRYEARLLPYLPDGALGYFAIPNVDGAIGEALRLLEQRAQPGTALDAWWSSDEGRQMREALAGLEGVASSLGDELVLVLAAASATEDPMPLVVAEVAPGGEAALRAALDALASDSSESIAYRVNGSLLLISNTVDDLARLESVIGLGAGSQFAMEIEGRYRQGVAWLAALDIGSIVPQMTESAEETRIARALGVDEARYVIFEQKSTDMGDQSSATVSFAGRRTGVASWLATPGPLGSAEYVSPDAIMAGSAATRDPGEALDQLLSRLGPDSELARGLDEFERETGVRFGEDIAESLGTDFTFAIVAPTVPVPGWVAVIETVDAASIDSAMRRLVDAANLDEQAQGGSETFELTRETANGRTWNTLSISDADGTSVRFEWTYHLGYLVAAADRALALRAIGVRDSGGSLVHSAAFEDSFPETTGLHASGFVWVNPERLAELAALVDGSAQWLAESGSREPILVVVSGESQSVQAATRRRLSGVLVDLLLGAHASGAAD